MQQQAAQHKKRRDDYAAQYNAVSSLVRFLLATAAFLWWLVAWLIMSTTTVLQAQEDRSFFYADSTERVSYTISYYPVDACGVFASDSVSKRRSASCVLICFRLRCDMLVFIPTALRQAEEGQSSVVSFSQLLASSRRQVVYRAVPFLQIDFSDAEGVIRTSALWQDTVSVSNEIIGNERLLKERFVYGSVWCTVESGLYALTMNVGSPMLPKMLTVREKQIVVPDSDNLCAFSDSPMIVTQPLQLTVLADAKLPSGSSLHSQADSGTMEAVRQAAEESVVVGVGLGASIPFGQPSALVFPLWCVSPEDSLSYTIYALSLRSFFPSASKRSTSQLASEVFVEAGAVRLYDSVHLVGEAAANTATTNTATVGVGQTLVDSRNRFSGIRLAVKKQQSKSETQAMQHTFLSRKALGEIVLNSAVLSEGVYRITVVRHKTSRSVPTSTDNAAQCSCMDDTLMVELAVEWHERPRSLRVMNYAIDLMKYILTDAEHAALLQGNEQEAEALFAEYWRRLDPTPRTVFNEALAAYYKRVDEAFFRFSEPLANGGMSDGARSERGKVLVLFGEPTSVRQTATSERGTAADVVTEVWRYDNGVRKEFIFEVGKYGKDVLKKVREL